MRVFFHRFYHHLSQWMKIITWPCSSKTIRPNHESTENMNLSRPDSDPCHVAISSGTTDPPPSLHAWSAPTAGSPLTPALRLEFPLRKKNQTDSVFHYGSRFTMAGLSPRGCVAFKTKTLRRCVWQNLSWSRNRCFSMHKKTTNVILHNETF